MEPKDLFARLEAQHGLPSGYMDSMWAIESGRGRHMLNRSSGAAGHFQFLPRTAKAYNLEDPNDLAQSADAAARYAASSARSLRKSNLPVTPTTLYTLHQQGPAGGRALLSNPEAKAVDVLSPFYRNAAVAESAITGNGGRADMTAGEFINHIASLYASKSGRPIETFGAKPRAPTATTTASNAPPSTWKRLTAALQPSSYGGPSTLDLISKILSNQNSDVSAGGWASLVQGRGQGGSRP